MKKSVHADAYLAVIQALKDARVSARLTQTEVGKRLKRPQSFVAKYERGERRLDILEFALVARALGIDSGRLFAQLVRRLR